MIVTKEKMLVAIMIIIIITIVTSMIMTIINHNKNHRSCSQHFTKDPWQDIPQGMLTWRQWLLLTLEEPILLRVVFSSDGERVII